MTNQNLNQHHIYETSLLGWVVQELINGGTDWYTPAAFHSEGDAIAYCNRAAEDDPERAYVVAYVGTLHRKG
jgi:hypothetical protein